MKTEIINNLIDGQSIAFIASVDEAGYPNQKAMLAPRKREGLKKFYLTTNTSSMRVRQYQNNSKASIYFCDSRKFQGVMLIGEMEVLTDQKSKDMIWQEGDEIYYTKGKTDPDYCVLCFTTKSARYYEGFKSESFDFYEQI